MVTIARVGAIGVILVLTTGCALDLAVSHYRQKRAQEEYLREACQQSPPFRAREKSLCDRLLAGGKEQPAASPDLPVKEN